MLYSEIIAVCSQIHTKHINTLCGQNVELLNLKHVGTYSNHWSLKGYVSDVLSHSNQFTHFSLFCGLEFLLRNKQLMS
jgi:hypothetical protein